MKCLLSKFASCAVVIFFGVTPASSFHHDNTAGDHFLHRTETEGVAAMATSWETFAVEGMAHLRTSLMATITHDRHAEPADPVATSVKLIRKPKGQPQYFRPVSTTLKCVMVLTIASLVVYTVLSISRNSDELAGAFQPSTLTETLTIGSRIGAAAPMMCMLFVSCRMYVLATTEGLGEPPKWVKSCMWVCVGGVGLQLLLVLLLPQFTKKIAHMEAQYDMTMGHAEEAAQKKKAHDAAEAENPHARQPITSAAGEQNDVHPTLSRVEFAGGGAMKVPFWILQAVSVLCIYGGISGVLVGIITFPAQTTQVSPAVKCTMLLTVLYFLSTAFLFIARVVDPSDGVAEEDGVAPVAPFTQAALAMSTVVRKAPMFAVFFLAARMRALQLDPPHGMPPFWMQCLFFTITGLMYAEAVVAAIIGATSKMKKAYYGVYTFESEGAGLHWLQHLMAWVTYVSLALAIYGTTHMTWADGSEAPLSTTLKCVVMFEYVYFGVMFWQSAVLLREVATGQDCPISRDASVAAGISLGMAPLLCILFVATRMRALQITQQEGAPPGWAQDCMNIAVFATCMQAVCCLLMPIFLGSASKVDEDGNPDYDLEPMVGAYAIAVLKYVMLIALHLSVMTVCASVYLMTPETANSEGRFVDSTRALFKMLAMVMLIFFCALLFSSAKVVGWAVKQCIESIDQVLLGVDITIKKVALMPSKGYVHIQKMRLCQPEEECVWTRDENGKLVGKKTGKPAPFDGEYIAEIGLILLKINVWRIISTLGKEFELQNLSIQGIHLNIEKPSIDVKKHDSNLEYITQFLDAQLGLTPPPSKPGSKATAASSAPPAPKPAEVKKPEEKKAAAPPPDIPKIILHKIMLGDMSVRVTLKQVPVVGQISFAPGIGLIHFNDIQQDFFGGRDDLTPGETVACIIKGVASRIFSEVIVQVPKQLASVTSNAVGAATRQVGRAITGKLEQGVGKCGCARRA